MYLCLAVLVHIRLVRSANQQDYNMSSSCPKCQLAKPNESAKFCVVECGSPFPNADDSVTKSAVTNPLNNGDAHPEPHTRTRKRTLTRTESGHKIIKPKVGTRFVASLLSVDDVQSEFSVDLELYLQWKQPEIQEEDAPDGYIKLDDATGSILKPDVVLIAYKSSELIED